MRGQSAAVSRNSRDNFIASIDWMLKMMQTQKELYFALVGLRLSNRDDLEQTLGNANASRLVEAYVERLREALNEADLMVRTDDENVLVMVPNSDKKHVTKIHATIRTLSEQARQTDSIGPAWKVRDMQVDSMNGAHATAESLLAQLCESGSSQRRAVRAA